MRIAALVIILILAFGVTCAALLHNSYHAMIKAEGFDWHKILLWELAALASTGVLLFIALMGMLGEKQ